MIRVERIVPLGVLEGLTMVRWLCGLVALLAFTPARAGMYHTAPANICADCHTMHGSMAHDYEGATPVSVAPRSFGAGSWLPNQGAPQAYLLKGTQTGVCVACHDGQTWAPDVIGANANTYVRSAGYIPVIGAQASEQGRGHSIGFSGATPGPSAAAPSFTDFTCASCHSPHGRPESFRNLNPYAFYLGANGVTGYPRFVVSQTPFATTPSGAVADVRIAIPAYVPGDFSYYANANVVFENGRASALDRYCGNCHGLFHDDSGGAPAASVNQDSTTVLGHFIRHPSNDEIGMPAGTPGAPSYTTKVYGTSTSPNGHVGCLSCHRAHGTANAFALFYAKAASPTAPNVLDDTESGAGPAYGGLCSNCHAQAL